MSTAAYFLAGLVLSAAGAVAAQTSAAPCTTHTIQVQRGLIYTQGVSGPLRADVYEPQGDGMFPVILFIHGGGWINGDRTQMERLARDLAGCGYVGFAIDYDVAPAHFPAALNESLQALQYIRSHAGTLRVDADRVAVAGSSAGGELAALVALDPMFRGDAPETRTAIPRVQAAVILNGVLDLQGPATSGDMVSKYLGGPCLDLPETCADASPMTHVHPGAPPFFVGHGTADAVVPFAQAQRFTERLRAAHVPVRLYEAKDGLHTYWIREEFYAANLAAIEEFLAAQMAGAKK